MVCGNGEGEGLLTRGRGIWALVLMEGQQRQVGVAPAEEKQELTRHVEGWQRPEQALPSCLNGVVVH